MMVYIILLLKKQKRKIEFLLLFKEIQPKFF